MKVDLSIDTKRLQAKLKATQKEIDVKVKKALLQTAQFGTTIILDRTEVGVGYVGKFKPYTSSYSAFRAKRGRKTTPDLNFTGKMLGSIQSRNVKKGVAEIYFSRATEAKKAAFNNELRPFFGFNVQEQNRLAKFFQGRLK